MVGTLATGDGPAIGLRADMDALPFAEANTFAHRSTRPGQDARLRPRRSHGDAAGRRPPSRRDRRFRGTVHFIFQPAEENEAGGKAMVEDGLFERFPVDAVFGLHNWPGLPVGQIAVTRRGR